MSISEVEKKALGDFCRVNREREEIKREQSLLRKESVQGKRTLTEMLQYHMEDYGPNAVFRLPSNGDSEASVVKLKKTTVSKQLTSSIVRTAMKGITIEHIEDQNTSKSKKKKEFDNFVQNALFESVMKSIRMVRHTHKSTVNMSKSAPRKCNINDLEDAPARIQELVHNIQTLKTELSECQAKFQAELESLDEKEAECKNMVDTFLEKNDMESFKLNVHVEGERIPYYIKRATHKKKKPMSVKELSGCVKQCIAGIFDNSPMDSTSELTPILPQILHQIENRILDHMSQRENYEEIEKLMLLKGRGKRPKIEVAE